MFCYKYLCNIFNTNANNNNVKSGEGTKWEGTKWEGTKWEDIKYEDTCEFKFPITSGKVIKVYDADTITIATKLPFNDSPMYRFSVRLNGIDAPEIKGKGISDEEKEVAIIARNLVSNMVLNKVVKLENIQNEKYGRILADVYIGDVHLNEYLLKNRYVVKYDGGTKKKPTYWLNYRINGIM